MNLGNWTLIDIETTGIDHNYDEIIDIGYLRFEGTKLVKKYSSLVQTDIPLSQFIQKLTGIKQEQVSKAPRWDQVQYDLEDLEDDYLLAHNSDFEKMFLEEEFRNSDGNVLCEFHDSIPFLGLIFPERSSLNLESFIQDFGIAEHEMHRGFEDSLDLLKVLLATVYLREIDGKFQERSSYLDQMKIKYRLEDSWYFKLFSCTTKELQEIADQIEFEPERHCRIFLEKYYGKNSVLNEKDLELEDMGTQKLKFESNTIREILQDEEGVKEKIPFYRFRKSQEDLSLRTGQSFKNGVHTMIQAPTGTGKTLGYMIPASLFSMSEDKQVLVATGTKTLQNQALEKDLPQLRKIMGLGKDSFKVERLIGSSNHLCEMLFRREASEGLLLDLDSYEERYTQAYFEFIFFLNDTQELNITRGDLAYILKKKFKNIQDQDQEIAVDFKACTGKRCPFKHGCTYLQGLIKAKDANVIIGNHALMFSWPRGFPRPGHIIVDEAHKIEDEASSAFTFELTQGVFSNFVKALGNLQGMGALFYLISTKSSYEEHEQTEIINNLRTVVKDHSEVLNDQVSQLNNTCEIYFKKRPRYTSMYWNEGPMPNDNNANNELARSIVNIVKSMSFVFKDLYTKLSPYAQMFEPAELKEDSDLSAYTKFESFFSQIEEIFQGLEHLIDVENSTYVSSLKFHEDQGFCLYSAPLDVGQVVHDKLLEPSESVVFTSATLGNSEGDMGTKGIEWPLGYLYLKPERRFKTGFYLPPVYDYKSNAKVFLCDDTPKLYDKDFVPEVLKSLIPMIKDIGGRSLLLFSARTRFEIAREILLEKLNSEIPIFIQGMGNQVVEDYKKSERGVLLGMEAFGEGIDLPGESLKFVFIDKIPDMRQDLLYKERRDFYEKSFGNEFLDYFMANRARKLQQKLGRLLRRETDSGGAIIVDSRIKGWKSRTTNQFFQLMKPYDIKRGVLKEACSEISEFINQ